MADEKTSKGTLSGAFPVPKGALLAAVILLIVEFGAARQDWLWDWSGHTPAGIVAAMDRQVITPAQPPKVLVMGSSRIRDGVAPRDLESTLGLQQGDVLNVALSQGTPKDALLLYTRHREKFAKASVVVLGLEDWYVNAGYPPTDRQRRNYTLSERLEGFTSDHYPSLIAGWAWRTYDARRSVKRLAQYVTRGRQRDIKVSDDGRVVWREETGDRGPSKINVARVADRYMGHWKFKTLELEAIKDLEEMVKADGSRLMLFQPPLRNAYIDYVEAEHAKRINQYRDAIKDLGIEMLFGERGSDFGLEEELFYDYGHCTPAGATIITRRLGEWLKAQGVR
ncbi:MAG: hypothetical protein ACE366_31085 [Bradymonadia bacterium]